MSSLLLDPTRTAADPVPAARPAPSAPSVTPTPAVRVSGRPEPAELAAALACLWLLAGADRTDRAAVPRPARWSCRSFAGPRSWQAAPAGGSTQWTRS